MTTCEECHVEVDHSLGQVWDTRIVYCPLHGAAPDLLAALQGCVAALALVNLPKQPSPEQEAAQRNLAAAAKRAYAAIAAATGGQHGTAD